MPLLASKLCWTLVVIACSERDDDASDSVSCAAYASS